MTGISVPESPGEARDGPGRGGVIRVAHRRGYTVLDNTAVRHPQLSFMATGVLAYLLSLPDGATMRSDRLSQLPGKEGRDAVRRCLRELEAAGFLMRERRQDERGRWYTVQTIFEVPVAGAPVDNAEAQVTPKTDSQASVGETDANTLVTPETGFQASVDQASVDRTSVHRASVDQALRDQVPLSSTKNTPSPTAHAVGQQSDPSAATEAHRRPRRGTRADGTNLRALAVRDAAAAARAQQLTGARTYGGRLARLDATATEASLAEQLRTEAARDSRVGWDEERIAAAVTGFAEVRLAEPVDVPAPPGELQPGPGGELAARAARLAQRALTGVAAQPASSLASGEPKDDGPPA